MSVLNIPQVTSFKFPCKWKPGGSYYKDMSEMVFKNYLSGGYWDLERAMDSFLKKMSLDEFKFLWNEKSGKTKVLLLEKFLDQSIDWRTPEDEQATFNSNRTYVANTILDEIPVDFLIENNRSRLYLFKYSDREQDFLGEAVKARIAGEEEVYNFWIAKGKSLSKDPAFFEYSWSTIKRGKGSVDLKLELLRYMFSNDVFSNRILGECAKRGTKRVKRVAVDSISDIVHAKRRSVERLSSDSTDTIRSHYLKQVQQAEDVLLLFADSSDYTVVNIMANCLSADNLPWIMPSAANWPHLMRDVQRRIDKSDNF
tara:strand:+ start:26212 stop:27147 length:936 start_codon:yes stop_codon:yes gene_type:complete